MPTAWVSRTSRLDAIVFTVGIGENSAEVCGRICERLAWLGVELDQAANHKNASVISKTNSKVNVLVVPTNEEAIIAEATHTLIIEPSIGDKASS